ncbi:hypothetical protein FO519_000258 [Halicephalobus sp. NKZ332]|nr:hypothetical protein FO519_000258 [Halicephalobus sp. NKZ332]
MLPPGSSSSEVLLTESAMVASVSEVDDVSSTSTDDFSDIFTIRNLYDIRGYCHFDLPDAEFKIVFDESESQFVVELLSGPHIILHIELNGHSIGHFDHRFPYESAQALGVRGGIHVKKIEFQGFPFQNQWHEDHGSHDWGHGGFIGNSTKAIIMPAIGNNPIEDRLLTGLPRASPKVT